MSNSDVLAQTTLITVTNTGYLLYTLNLLKSLQPYGLDRDMLIVCMDRPAATALAAKGYRTTCEDQDGLGRFCPWNTKGYDQICYTKLQTVHRLLSEGRHVWMVDGDVVVLRDPRPDLVRGSAVADLVIQNDAQDDADTTNLCTGYLWIRSTPETIRCYAPEQVRARWAACAFDNNDQTYVNQWVKPVCRTLALPIAQYPNGKVFLEQRVTDPVLVHFNWIKGHQKLVTMKRSHMWWLTPEEERA
jgi:hypothetical protein